MKRKFVSFVLLILTFVTATFFAGCGLKLPTSKNYNDDVTAVKPEDITAPNFVVKDGETYYTSEKLCLMVEVNGAFYELEYFSLDQNKRVYDDVYFYEKDYFFMITGDYRDIYASLGDSADLEYAEEEREQGYDIQINVKKSGIYKVIFDVDTLKFYLQFKSDIDTPVYYPIKNCSIYSIKTSWVEMSQNPDNADEFVISNFEVDAGVSIVFYSNIHTSNYKVTLDSACQDKYCSGGGKLVGINVGGKYNFYINKKTYVVRAELLNPETATYKVIYYEDGDFKTLQPSESNVPYIFKKRITVERKYQNLPDFYSDNYTNYKLSVVDIASVLYCNDGEYYFKQVGSYDLTINLQTFELTVEMLPE